MKNNVRKLLAVFLSALMLATSVPFSAFAAEDADLTALKSTISEYESAMDGTVYYSMKDAYDSYINAKEAAYAYEYGNKTDLDIVSAANKLAADTATMKSHKWTSVEYSSPEFNYGGAVPNDYVKGVIYSAAPAAITGLVNQKWQVAFLMPKEAVFLYDGSDMRIPVMVAGNNQGVALGTDKAFCAVWPTTGDPNAMDDNKYFQFKQVWNGSYDIDTVNGEDTPLSTNEFKWSGAYNSDEQTNKDDSLKGYNNETQKNTNGTYRSQKIDCTKVPFTSPHRKTWRQYANYLQYADNAANEAWSNGTQSVKIAWYVKSWENNLGDKFYSVFYDTNTTFYVVDYRGVKEAIKKAGNYFNFGYGSDGVSNYYVTHQLDSVLDAVEALQADPSDGFTSSNVAARAQEIASDAKSNISAINSATVNADDFSGYKNLAAKIAAYKDTYLNNNSQGIYTADSYSAFKSAYEASVAEAAAVAVNGFTSVKTAAALETAYKNLNKVIKPSGESGTTTYAFDEETGTVTITGPGAMADYDSAEDSPFGNNDSITKIVIEDGVTNIGTNTFNNCRNLREITVPASLTYSENAFADCPKLETVYITGGAVNNESAANAPWNLSSVERVHLGTDKDDMSVDSIGTNVFLGSADKAFYVYNSECDIPNERVSTFGNNPTIYCYVPSTAYNFAKEYSLVYKSLGHVHSWEVLQVVAPTCKNGGYTVYKCKYDDFCTETKRGDEVAALGHDLELTETVPATCTENGYELYSCSRCDYTTKKNSTKKTSHSFTGNAVPAYSSGSTDTSNQFKHKIACANDCGTFKEEYCSFEIADKVTIGDDVFTVFKCPVCQGTYYVKSDVKADEFEVFFVGSDNKIIDTVIVKKDGTVPSDKIPAFPQNVGHEYKWQLNGADSNPATVIINETKIFQLVDTPKTYTVTFLNIDGAILDTQYVAHGSKPENIEPLDNDEAEQLPNGNPDQDSKHYILAWNDDLNPADVVITDDTVFNVVKKAVPHNFTDTEIEKPTCTATGIVSKYCEDCKFFIPEAEVPMTDHTPEVVKGKAATCANSGLTDGSVCKVCGTELVAQKIIKATGKHTWDKGVKSADGKKITYTCTVCKKTKTEDVPQNTTPTTPASPYAAITPSDKVANAAPVNKSIKRPKKVRTTSLSKKKQMRVRFGAIKGAQNYRVMYRKAGTKTWSYAWTNGKTEYYLKNLKNGGLYEFCFAAYKKNSKGQWERGNYSKITRRYYYKHALKKYNGKNGTITLKWKKKKGASAYQIQYSTKKSMAGAKTITINNPKTTSYKITGLKKGKKYYVRVRANKKYKKKKFTGEFSKRRKVKA